MNRIAMAGTSFSQVADRGVPLAFQTTIRDGQEALAAAGIDYRVDSVPLSTLTDAPMAARFHAAVRSSDGAIVGVNSSRFAHHQPSDLAALGDAIIRVRGDAYYSAGGQSHDGRLQFLAVTLNEEPIMGVDGGYFHNVLLVNGTNGNSMLKGIPFNFRLGCMNQFPKLMRRGESAIFKLGHRWSARQAMGTAIAAVQDAMVTFDDMDREMHRLLEVEVSNPFGFAAEIAGPRPDDGRARTEWDKRFDAIVAEYHADHNEPVRGTAWGMVMAAQGVDEHGSRCKNGRRGLQRHLRVVNGSYPLASRALALV